MDESMTLRDMTLRVFRRQPVPHVLFQPRFEPWFALNHQQDALPPECRGRAVREVYDQLGASMRYCHYYTGQPDPVAADFEPTVKIDRHPINDERKAAVYHTPHGDLTAEWELTIDRTWRQIVFPGKSADDLPALTWLMERRRLRFDREAFEQGEAFVGDRGVAQFWLPKSPYMALAQQWMRFEAFHYAMVDAPQKMRALMDAIDRSYDPLYEQLCEARATPILNFGENIAEAYLSPAYFRDHLLPWYHARVGQLRHAGIHTHIHIDGYFKSLLPQLNDLPHDGLEALTPQPQGDVTLDEIAAHTGDKILLDVIPAVLFLQHHPREELQACVEAVVDRFGPRLILGISDELPQGGDEESYERLRWTADYARSQTNAATV